ncbi:MAG: Rne/Rng family ribonuclease [Alphaproteobacteria bacterium]|nr:MAG: Rne/Rng family ribonuclease [Alphaproteobacteria bacterium]
MVKRMLIDAVHASERRVAVVENDKLVAFDFETANNQSRKGNIFLAKVVRVEPSLQAAFLDYGQEKHGFLAFTDIQHSNYQIPVEDRKALEEEQQKILAESEINENLFEDVFDTVEQGGDDQAFGNATNELSTDRHLLEDKPPSEKSAEDQPDGEDDDDYDVEISGGTADDAEDKPAPSQAKTLGDFYRRYKIQEVIKRGQVMLVQVVKDERGSKGAALTTHISLPGRYCVLMPNAYHKGGVSRKISDVKDRRRLRTIIESLDLPTNMSLIIRTAGLDRNKSEIRRDSEYLMRLWDEVREKTLRSNAPCLVYEEGDIIRQALRDLFRKDMEEVLVDGVDAYQEAKNYMKQLSPSYASRVKKHVEKSSSLFAKYGVEAELSHLYAHEVTLPSGGYLIINHTEALVSIDINSGRATRERNIVDTAYKTNLEAAEEIGRQVRLRNLSGLLVVDFIDMDNSKHVHAVERKFRDAMREDRARVQIGHISQFGLLEFSRQRLGASYLETITQACSHCGGRGVVPAQNLLGVRVLRKVQEAASSSKAPERVRLALHPSAALYILNDMRQQLLNIEEECGKKVAIASDHALGTEDVIDLDSERKPPQRPQQSREGRLHERNKRPQRRSPSPENQQKLTKVASQNSADAPPKAIKPVSVDGATKSPSPGPSDAGDIEPQAKRSRSRNRRSRRRRGTGETPLQAGEVAAEKVLEKTTPSADAPSVTPQKNKQAIKRTTQEAELKSKAEKSDSTADKKRRGWWKRLVENKSEAPE